LGLLAFIFTLELVLAFDFVTDDHTAEGSYACTNKGGCGVATDGLPSQGADTATNRCTIGATAKLTTAADHK
jgi:hypothetical protein